MNNIELSLRHLKSLQGCEERLVSEATNICTQVENGNTDGLFLRGPAFIDTPRLDRARSDSGCAQKVNAMRIKNAQDARSREVFGEIKFRRR